MYVISVYTYNVTEEDPQGETFDTWERLVPIDAQKV